MRTRGSRLRGALGLVLGGWLALAACDTTSPLPSPGPATATPPLPPAIPTLTVPPPTATRRPPATATVAPPVPTERPPAVPGTALTVPAPVTPPPTLPPAATQAGCPPGAHPTQAGLGDPYYPLLGNGGYDALHYTLVLTADVAANTLAGTATMTARATQALPAFDLDLSGLAVARVAVDGTPAPFARRGSELVITPTTALPAAAPFTTTVTYGGNPHPLTDGSNSPAAGWINTGDAIYVASEPAGASTWYPVNNHPCDKATYTMRITVPQAYTVAANGRLQQTIDHGAWHTFVWATRDPVASYLVTIDVARFDRQTATGPNGLPLRYYFPPGLPAAIRAGFQQTPDMIAFFSDRFGPFPFEAYGGVVAESNLGFALETQTLSLFGRSVGEGSTSESEVLAHELAHQWFGDSVSLADWQDIWLNEGFATYAQWLWLEHTSGPAALDQRIRQMYTVVQSQQPPPPGTPPPDDLFNLSVYLRGGLTLHALRLRVGDTAFFQILRTYAARYRYGNASTADFIAVAEQVSGQSLHPLFDSWLYAPQLPPLPPGG